MNKRAFLEGYLMHDRGLLKQAGAFKVIKDWGEQGARHLNDLGGVHLPALRNKGINFVGPGGPLPSVINKVEQTASGAAKSAGKKVNEFANKVHDAGEKAAASATKGVGDVGNAGAAGKSGGPLDDLERYINDLEGQGVNTSELRKQLEAAREQLAAYSAGINSDSPLVDALMSPIGLTALGGSALGGGLLGAGATYALS